MPSIWIDVTDASGNRYGSAPITTATGWQSTRPLDAIGTFSFSMPATDPVLECADGTPLLKNKRDVRCWTAGDDPLNPRDHPRELGAGIIEQIDLQLSESGASMLNVSGVDLLSELANVTVGELQLFKDDVRLPSAVNIVIPALSSAVVWHPDDSVTLLRDPLTYLYIKSPTPFFRVTLDLSSPFNTAVGVLKAQYFNEDASPMGWENVPIDDGTKVEVAPAVGETPATYAPLAKDGVIEFESPSGWGKTLYGIYDLRLYSDEVDLTEVKIHSIMITERVPTMTALQDTMALAPAGWSLDPSGKLITEQNTVAVDRKGIYQQMNKESVLATLGMIAEQLGEHFILSPTGRRVLWLGTDKQASGLRAIGPANPAGEPDASTLYITDLSRTLDSTPLFTRIYAAGGGVGEERITLSDATDTAPAGYTLNTTEGWLQHTAAVAEFGRIDYPKDYPDIVALDNGHDAQAYAGNALLRRAYEELRRGCVIQEAYQLSVLPALYPLYPGSTIYVSYHVWTVDGFHAVNIEETLWVLDVTTQVAPSGAVYTVGLTVAKVDTYPIFDGSRTAQAINAGRSSRAVTPPTRGLTDSNIGEVAGLYVKNGSVTQVVKKKAITVVPDGVHPPNEDTQSLKSFTTQDGRITFVHWVNNG
jgi:hypothetical protein